MQAGYSGKPGEIDEAAAEFARRSEAPVLAAAAMRFGTAVAAAVPRSQPTPTPGATLH
jgi:hypothetical protein